MPSIAAGARHGNTTRATLTWAVIVLLALWAGWTWLSTLARIPGLYVAIPTEDYWRVVQNLKQIESLDLRFLWRQHNEHRIVFPDIVFALDVLLAHGRRILPIVINFLCYLGSWLILVRLISRESSIPPTGRAAIISLTGVLMGWKGCTLVLANPFLVQWTIVELAALASLMFVSAVPEKTGHSLMVASIASGIVATYSSGNGLLLWIVLLTAAYVLSISQKQMMALVVSAILADGLYFVGYQFSGKTNLLNLLLHPWYGLCFIAVYLSMPFGGMKSPQFGVYIGLLNLCLITWLFVTACRSGLVKTRLGVVLFGYYAFTLLTALLTAAGRMDISDATFGGAKATRYLVPVTINWAVFLVLAIWIASIRKWRIISAPLLVALFTFLISVSFLKLKWWLQTGTREFIDGQVTQLSIQNGLSDRRLLLAIFPDPHFVESYLPLLREFKLSIFYKDKSKWLGKPLSQFGSEISASARGEVTRVFPVSTGVEIVGWGAAFKKVVVADEQGNTIGFGLHPPEGLPSELLSPETVPRLAWVAFVPAKYANGRFSVYLVDAKTKSLLRIRNSYDFPVVTAADKGSIGQTLSGLIWQRDTAWIPNGMGPHETVTSFNPASAVYGTWNGSDSQTGSISSSNFPVPAARCVIVPVLHGPSTAGLSVELLDGDRGTVIEKMPMQDEDVQWEFWRVPVPGQIQRLRLLARDQGEGFGQWLAVASPAECR